MNSFRFRREGARGRSSTKGGGNQKKKHVGRRSSIQGRMSQELSLSGQNQLSVIDRIMGVENSGSFLMESPSGAFSGSSAGPGGGSGSGGVGSGSDTRSLSVTGIGGGAGAGSVAFIRRSTSSKMESWQEFSSMEVSSHASRAELRRLSSEEFTVNKLNMNELEVYGRQKEIAIIRHAFQDVQKGDGKKVVVSIEGYSGTGKTVLAHELRADVLHQNKGLFCAGKFDLQNHAEPYTAFVTALSQLVDLLLQKEESFVRDMKRKLRYAVSEVDRRTVLSVVPSLDKVLRTDSTKDVNSADTGASSVPSGSLQGRASQLQFAFRKLFRVLANPGHPLVMVLDDMQWADEPSLQLLDALITDPRSSCFMLITTARSNEIDKDHPFVQKLKSFEEEGVRVERVEVGNLDFDSVNLMVSTMLRSTPDVTHSLANVVFAKTLGNPFFVLQFVKSLTEKSLLKFSFGTLQWHWNVNDITLLRATDNIADLMKGKLDQLQPECQLVLQVAACLGQTFEPEALEMLLTFLVETKLERDLSSNINDILETCVEEGILERSHGPAKILSFVHDQIQTAALALQKTAWDRAPEWPVRIGQKLLATMNHSVGGAQEQRLFLAVDLCNSGLLMLNEHERFELANYNLHAGESALNKGAYSTAQHYYEDGLAALGDTIWSKHQSLAMNLTTMAADAAYCNGRMDDMEKHLTSVLLQNVPLEQKMPAYLTRIRSLGAQEQFREAVSVGLDVLDQLGMGKISPSPNLVNALWELRKTKKVLEKHTLTSLTTLPVLQDQQLLFTMGVIDCMTVCAYFLSPCLFCVLWSKAVRISVHHGVCNYSTSAMAAYGMISVTLLGDARQADTYAQVALTLSERLGAKSTLAEVLNCVYCCINHWTHAMRLSIKPLLHGYQAGMHHGDIEFAMHCLSNYDFARWICGSLPLGDLVPDMEEHCDMMKRCGQKAILTRSIILLEISKSLLKDAELPTTLDELQELCAQVKAVVVDCLIKSFRMQLNYLFGQYDEAQKDAEATRDYGFKVAQGEQLVPRHHFFRGLIAVALAQQGYQKRKNIGTAKEVIKTLEKWTRDGCHDSLHRLHLLEAELAAVQKKDCASELYKAAIQSANRGSFVHDKALAHERAGVYHLEHDSDTFWASFHLDNAIQCYRNWGAVAKVDDLIKKHGAVILEATHGAPLVDSEHGLSVYN